MNNPQFLRIRFPALASVLAIAAWGGFLPDAASAEQDFSPALISAELSDTAVLPGDEFHVVLTMTNQGELGSLFPLRAFLGGQRHDKAEAPKLIGHGEPFPPTNLWRKNQPVVFGFALSVPAHTQPGEYDLSIFLRPRDGGEPAPLNVGSSKPEAVVPLGKITILPPGTTKGEPAARSQPFAKPPPHPAEISRPRLQKTLKLATAETEVLLDAGAPTIVRLGRQGPERAADDQAGRPDFHIFRKQDSRWFSTGSPEIEVAYRVASDAARVTYTAQISCQGQPAVECDLFFTLAENELRVGFENVRPQSGFILTSIVWPRLIEGSSPDLRLVNGRFSGRLIDPEKCVPGTVTHEATWIDPYVGGALCTPDTVITLGIDSPGDFITSSVGQKSKRTTAGFGLEFVHVIAARGADSQRWIEAAGSSMARLRIIERAPGAAPLTWFDAAKTLRKAVQDIKPPSIYQDSVIYKILLDSKDYKDLPPELPATSFAQAREILNQVSLLSDGIRQIAYLTGAQHEGQDTKYPDVFTTNPKLGTTDDLIALIRDGGKSNAVVSFHSCATEAYKDSPMWDERVIARDPTGGFFIYNRFAGGDCYWINQDQFARHGMRELINRIFSTYPITETYHIDVLSTRAANVDFNPANPCSPNAGYAGRLKMVEEFNRHGIDLTSEGFISWFVGKIGHAWLLKCEPYTSLLGEEEVPLVPMIYHGHATYGLPSELNPLFGMLYGATFSMDFMPLERMKFLWPGNSLPDSLYLQNFPFQMLRNREIQAYHREGDMRRVTYDEKTFVEIDVPDADLRPYRGYREGAPGKFRIVIDGKTIARDFTAFLPGPKAGSYLAYSKFGGEVAYDAPSSWSAGKSLKVECLGDDAAKASARLVDGKIVLHLPAGIPARVTQTE